jgi:hypothetical protein
VAVTSDSDFVRPCPALSRLRVHHDPDRSEGLQNRCMECAEDANKVSDGELGFDLDCGSDRVKPGE